MTSQDGVAFMRLSGERWYEADVASGTAQAVARSGADQVFAAYTGAGRPARPTDPAPA